MTHEGGPIHIMKRHSRRGPEEFDVAKLHASIVAACISAGIQHGHAESIAKKVTEEVTEWLATRHEVTSDDIRHVAAKYLRTHHPDAGYLYEQHRTTL